MKQSIFVLALVFVASSLVACGGGDGSSSEGSSEKLPRIAVVPKAGDVEFWKMVQGGVLKAASEETGYEVVWQPPAIGNDRSEQIKTIQNLIVKKVDAVAVAPIDAVDLVKSVSNAKKKGIKTVVWDSGLDDESAYESFVATDNFQGGVLCARAMAEAINESGSIGLLRFVEGSQSTEQREAGFLSEIKKYPNIQVISDSQRGGDEVKSQEVGARLLQTEGDKLDGIFCSNQTTTEGMLLALDKSPFKDKIKVVGFDFNPYIEESLRNGLLAATASQDPFNMGYLAVKTSINLLEDKPVEKLVDTGVSIVTKDNIDAPEMQQVLFPDYQKWIAGQ
ncbi:substrate-binding domain-containing protein [Algisphaera agarilytica]|uniref:Ribose transport system substrate-binding protein n=1 Tax=Algisphaera agarilytica TaxID=1385975 RepID=A0A7X0LL08_9BACT|nr:substrate-binding domain-containing protein [Algisphaera agarilytica]MBB6429498.1 ribose transport system substrate-binding protein [Algisphaera agarilytica]